MTRLSTGVTSTFRVEGGGRTAIVRVSDPKERPPPRVEEELRLLRHLRATGLEVADPLPASDGRLLVSASGPDGARRQVALLRHLPGRPPRLGVETAFSLGALVARFHRLADGFEPLADHVPVLDREDLLDHPAQVVARRLANDSASAETLARVTRFLDGTFEGMPRGGETWGIIHGDAHHLNALDIGEGRLALLDFEQLAFGWRVYDLATLLWGTLGRGGGTTVWDALVRGYASVRELLPEEAIRLTRFMALRHLWWLGFHARHWGRWVRPWLGGTFFSQGVATLDRIVADACR